MYYMYISYDNFNRKKQDPFSTNGHITHVDLHTRQSIVLRCKYNETFLGNRVVFTSGIAVD